MNNFFCSDNSRKVGENIIGTASNNETYILIECPQPWVSNAFASKWVPENLNVLVKEVKQSKLPIKFLLIANNSSHKVNKTTLLIYEKKKGFISGYSKREFQLESIEQAAITFKKWFAGKSVPYEVESNIKRDILICTHGSHDKCCARYGNPFYFYGSQMISDLGWDEVRIWKSSHFGGHRFAPTMIDLPDGRYYGRLDNNSFESVLSHTGNIENLKNQYRGWGILPKPLQVMEQELMLRYGWDWFTYRVRGKVLQQDTIKDVIQGEITFIMPDESLYTYQGKLVQDNQSTVEIKTACNTQDTSICSKYVLTNLSLTTKKAISRV
ncbi:MAG: sucrase ferredoxin [Mastigocoleus sp.]